MPHISRHELKSDEFVSGLDAAYEFYLQNQRKILTGAIAAAVVIAIGAALVFWWRSRNAKAEALLAAGLQTYHAPLAQPGQPATPGQAFATVRERAAAAQKQFQPAADGYGSTRPGRLARYYLGLSQIDTGNLSTAEKTLDQATHASDSDVASLAKMALANLYQSEGKTQQAASLYRDLIQHPSATVAKSEAMLQLADLERTTNPSDAANLYQQVAREYPNTNTANQATQQLASLRH